RSSAANSATTTTGTAPATYDSTLSDLQTQFENQFEQLQTKIAQLQPTPPPAPPQPIGGLRGGSPPANLNGLPSAGRPLYSSYAPAAAPGTGAAALSGLHAGNSPAASGVLSSLRSSVQRRTG
ncbi:MAG: hypothetical protein ACRDVE_18000, partial [Actinocrinis sp.]